MQEENQAMRKQLQLKHERDLERLKVRILVNSLEIFDASGIYASERWNLNEWVDQSWFNFDS